jgi:hypothetical protein
MFSGSDLRGLQAGQFTGYPEAHPFCPPDDFLSMRLSPKLTKLIRQKWQSKHSSPPDAIGPIQPIGIISNWDTIPDVDWRWDSRFLLLVELLESGIAPQRVPLRMEP